MYGPDAPYKTEPKAKEHHPHAHHHLSPWAIWIGFTIALVPIGIVTSPFLLILGLLLSGIGVVGWFVEDYKEWPKGPNPLTQPTQGIKDNGWWGVVLFLATEVILFGSIFAVWYVSKAHSPIGWPPAGTPELPVATTAVFTAFLVASGFVMMWGERGMRKNNRRQFVIGFVGAILLGTIFLAGQVYEYIELVQHGFRLDTNIYTTVFYMLTGTHGFHVLGGLIFLTVVLVRGAKGNFSADRHTAMTAAGYYWHFVDIVWLFLFAVVYLGWF